MGGVVLAEQLTCSMVTDKKHVDSRIDFSVGSPLDLMLKLR